MTKERWQSIVGQIKDSFGIIEEGNEPLGEDEGVGECHYVIFKGPLGRMKLEFITRPVILDKKTKYTNRIGSETVVEYVYSDEEKTHKLDVFKWDEDQDEWIEMEASKLGF
ncbi:hypothetical protein HGA64_03950 [Candidatus Falkowbacteria bacterium]|nr:hypothetical protein [Candidatus Falkowbacteria bacterium]